MPVSPGLPGPTLLDKPDTPETGTPAASSQGPGAGGGGGHGSKQRDPFLDNAKYLALVLVALGHAWGPLTVDSRLTETLYRFVYAFHMPAFVIVSGYLSRSYEGRPGQVKRLVTGTLVPYLVFEVTFTLVMRQAEHDPDRPLTILDPDYALWFLLVLFVWRLTSPIWKNLRHPFAVSVAVAMIASCTPTIGSDLDLQRMLQFLPFFVLGLRLRPEHLRAVRSRTVRLASVPFVAAVLVAAWLSVPRMDRRWLYHSLSAQQIGSDAWAGPVMTVVLGGCALALTACFLAWTPGRGTWFTVLGGGTIYGYLLHVYPVTLFRLGGGYQIGWVDTPHGRIVVSLATAVTVTLLCTPPVRRVLRFAVEPRARWLFRRDTARPARG